MEVKMHQQINWSGLLVWSVNHLAITPQEFWQITLPELLLFLPKTQLGMNRQELQEYLAQKGAIIPVEEVNNVD